jgi:hypothetical protein
MRLALVLSALLFSGCSAFDNFQLGARLDPNKVYLSPTQKLSVSSRDTYRYACVGGAMLCVQRGIGFDCECP